MNSYNYSVCKKEGMNLVYLDYCANAPVEQQVLDRFYEVTKNIYANPNSIHKLGREAEDLLNKSADHIASYFNVTRDELIFTSGATESNNLAIKGICERYRNKGKHIIIGSMEHNSLVSSAMRMQEMGFEVELAPVDQDGRIDRDELEWMIRDDTILVAIAAVDSELGIRQDIEGLASFLKNYPQLYFHVDASQAIGKVDINYDDVDLITFTPHKFGGINGTGVLVKKKNIGLKIQMDGGKSTSIYRSGTPMLANVVACDVALDLAMTHQKEREVYVKKLQTKILEFLSSYEMIHINNTRYSDAYVVNFSVKSVRAEAFSEMLEQHEIYLSTKTSCCPTNAPSKIVFALTKDKKLASTSLRLSLSYMTTEEELDAFFKAFTICYKDIFKNG